MMMPIAQGASLMSFPSFPRDRDYRSGRRAGKQARRRHPAGEAAHLPQNLAQKKFISRL
jgi:hypothetical protein